MRLWHKDLIHILPRQQLMGQWRECCLIMSEIAKNGTPNNLIVNWVTDYPTNHMIKYAELVRDEMHNRGIKCDWSGFDRWIDWPIYAEDDPTYKQLFAGKMNDRYLAQCVWNLCEKRDCGGLTREEFERIRNEFKQHNPVSI